MISHLMLSILKNCTFLVLRAILVFSPSLALITGYFFLNNDKENHFYFRNIFILTLENLKHCGIMNLCKILFFMKALLIEFFRSCCCSLIST